MDKRLILAVAGSGKTSHVIEQLDLKRRFLILTHTENNYYNIKSRVAKKFGFLPENINIFTYFSFLYSFCFKPFLLKQLKVKGITYDRCKNIYAKHRQRYIDEERRVYANRLVKLIEIEDAMLYVVTRLEKYFDMIIIDEIQDFAGHDFNLLPHIVKTNNSILFVGDFYQHTFDTSSDGRVNENIHEEYDAYIARFQKMGLLIDQDTLSHSYRCSPSVCKYVTDNLNINIASHREDSTLIDFVECKDKIRNIFYDNNIVKLFYQNSKKYYPHYTNNWGNSKGEDHYDDVCVVLNPTTYKYVSEGKLVDLNAQTKNRLYVAITRTKGSLFFIKEKAVQEFKSKNV